MSFITTMAVKDGIIMLGDMLCSNSSIKNKDTGLPLTGTNYYKKLFAMNDSIGISFCGNGTYEKRGQELNQNVNEFCRNNTFDNPHDAAGALLNYILYRDGHLHGEEMRKKYKIDGEPEFVIHVAGYVKSQTLVPLNGQKEYQEKIDRPYPEVCTICTVPSLVNEGWKRISREGPTGLWQCGNMRQIKHYVDKIKNDKDFINHLTLQEAVNAVKFIFDAARGFEWLADHIKTMSEDFEMLAITPDGVKWLKKHELELKETREVIL